MGLLFLFFSKAVLGSGIVLLNHVSENYASEYIYIYITSPRANFTLRLPLVRRPPWPRFLGTTINTLRSGGREVGSVGEISQGG